MKSIQNIATVLFMLAVAVLSAISILGVWEFFSKDVISKSFQTLGLLAVVAVIVMVAGRFIEGRSSQTVGGESVNLPSPAFRSIRRLTLSILIVAVSLLALLGVLTIWEVIHDKQVLYKTLGSLAILAFGSLVITVACLEREGKLNQRNRHWSAGGVILVLFLLYLVFSLFSRSLFW